MSTLAYYHPRQMEIDLADLSTGLYNELINLHGQIGKNDPPVLTCLGNSASMYVYRHQSGRYYARHFPGDNPGKHSHRISTMSDAHKRQSEYVARAADDAGLDAILELSTGGGTRLDAGVYGTINTGFEIQRSHLSREAAKTRTTKSFGAGWTAAWIHDKETLPDWDAHVPTARLSVRGQFDKRMPPPGGAKAVIRKFSRQRGKNGWEYQHEPFTRTLDELSYLIPAGEIIPVAIGGQDRRRVVLAPADAADIIDSTTYPGASRWEPDADLKRVREAAQRYTAECHHGAVAGYDQPVCVVCGHPLWAPRSVKFQRCAKHHEGEVNT